MHKKNDYIGRILIATIFASGAALAVAQPMPDALPGAAKKDNGSSIVEVVQISETDMAVADTAAPELNVENLLAALDRYGVKHKEIVAAQAILETGHFTSRVCLEKNNLFGLRRPGDGTYFEFPTWEESVRAYRDDVQYKYSGGDYYAFLHRIGYAEDRRYTDKVRRIEKRLSADGALKPEED